MHKWRYHSIMIRDLSIADSKLNAEGERGWELVSVCLIDANTARAYFKQPFQEETAEAQAHGVDETAVVTQNPFG
jgi:hypothetical protein